MKKINYLGEIFFFLSLAGILYLSYVIYKPFLGVILIAAAIASVFYNLYLKLLRHFNKNLSAFLMVLFISASIIIPLIIFLIYLSKQIFYLYDSVENLLAPDKVSLMLANLNAFTEKYFHLSIQEDYIYNLLAQYVSKFNASLISMAKAVLTNSTNLISSLLFLLLTLFFMFRDGNKLLIAIMRYTPLYDRYDLEIYHKFDEVSYAAFFATFITAIAQGLVASIGYAIVGVPVLFLSIATAIASIIPFVGTLLVWGIVVIYLLLISAWWKAIFLTLWGIFVIGLVDNILRPWLMKGKTNVHPMILFFAILGGIMTFGFWGIIYGPLIISVALTLLHIYKLEYADMIEENRIVWSQAKSLDDENLENKKKRRGRPRKTVKKTRQK